MPISKTNGANLIVLPDTPNQSQAGSFALPEINIEPQRYHIDEGLSVICWNFHPKEQQFFHMPGDMQGIYSLFIDLSDFTDTQKPGEPSKTAVYFKNPATRDYYSNDKGCVKGVQILLEEHYLRTRLQEYTDSQTTDLILKRCSGYLPVDRTLAQTLKNLAIGDMHKRGLKNMLRFQGQIYTILASLLSQMIPVENKASEEPETLKLIALNEHIKDEDYAEIPSIEAAARQLHVSVTKFKQLQKKVYLMPFLKYHQEQRLNKAKSMLLDPQTQIKDVAYSLGFQSGSHFARSFRQQFGIPPRDYQKIHLIADFQFPDHEKSEISD